jgi:hypothetical protein
VQVIVNVVVVVLAAGFGIVLAAFGAFLTVMGYSVLVRGVGEWWLARRSSSWRRTEGTVTSSEVVRMGTGRSVSYEVRVAYTFLVGNSTQTGSRIAFSTGLSPGHRFADEARQVAERYAEGKQVAVFFEEGRPELATLERNRPGAFQPFFFFVLLVGLGVAFVWLGLDIAMNAVTTPPPIA